MMQQDPKKGAKDYEKPSVKQKLAQSSSKKKVGVGEMGKPDLKAGFEAAMQKERDFVLNRAKIREEARDAAEKMGRGEIMRAANEASKNIILNKINDINSKGTKLLKSMSKEGLKKLKY
jgi:hypothetical protein